jgi:hypothetical protein
MGDGDDSHAHWLHAVDHQVRESEDDRAPGIAGLAGKRIGRTDDAA